MTFFLVAPPEVATTFTVVVVVVITFDSFSSLAYGPLIVTEEAFCAAALFVEDFYVVNAFVPPIPCCCDALRLAGTSVEVYCFLRVTVGVLLVTAAGGVMTSSSFWTEEWAETV